MPSVDATWNGRIARPADRVRMVGALESLAAAVAPCLNARWKPVDRVLPAPVRGYLREGECWFLGPVRVQGGVLLLDDFRGWETAFPFLFVVEQPRSAPRTLRGRLVNVYEPQRDERRAVVMHDLAGGTREIEVLEAESREALAALLAERRAEGWEVAPSEQHFALSDEPSVELRYHLESEFDELMAWLKASFIPGLKWWRYRPMSGLRSHRSWYAGLGSQVDREGAATERLIERLRAAHQG